MCCVPRPDSCSRKVTETQKKRGRPDLSTHTQVSSGDHAPQERRRAATTASTSEVGNKQRPLGPLAEVVHLAED